MRIDTDIKLDYQDVLIRPKRSTLTSRKEVQLERNFKLPHSSHTIVATPIIAANMDGIGTLSMMKSLKKHGLLTALVKHLDDKSLKETDKDFAFVTTGISDSDFERMERLKSQMEIKMICLDVANGYTQRFVDSVKKMREMFPDSIIMAGNVVTGEMTEELVLAGADIVKIGIGPGSACTTRKVTGVGYPQLSAVIECADAAHGLKGLICADGGHATSADIAKAFGAGADFVMLGGMLAGHDQSEFEAVEKNDKKYMSYYGSSSNIAMQKHSGGKSEYRSSEGRNLLIPYRGDVEKTILDILGGLRSACTYVGAPKLKELSKRTTFVLVNRQLNTVYEKYEV